MKVIRRNKVVRRNKNINPIASIPLWGVSLFSYIMAKGMGIIDPEREWAWWVLIPSLFMVWVIMNWKIVRDGE
jgi:hypothetical protein